MECQICKSKEIREYKVVAGVPIYQCQRCKLGFVDSKTPRKMTSEIYSFSDYQKREAQFKKRYQGTVSIIKTFAYGKKALEVGAGFGLLSSMLIHEGFEVDVLEPGVNPEYLKGLNARIYKSTLENYSKEARTTYDVIILYDVLEHVDNPQETIKQLENLLDKRGVVLIQTPNYLSLMARIVRNWSWWMMEDHRYFFSRKSLDLLFKKNKWEKRFQSTYEEWADFKKNLDGNFTDKASKALYLGLFIPFYFLFRRFIWRFGYGGLHLALWSIKR